MNSIAPGVHTVDDRAEPQHAVDLGALGALLGAVLSAEGVTHLAEASVVLVDPEEIAALKAEYLDGDGSPTDVLSFPVDGATPPDSEDDTWVVGDVVLCPAIAAAQAAGHAGSLEDELALLTVHGGLHLLGWDHDDLERQTAMWTRERELLIELHREPQRDPWRALQ